MESLNRAYNGIRSFVDDFANTTTSSTPFPSKKLENRDAWYAEWDENYMGGFLDHKLTKAILRKIADTYYGKQLDSLLDEATELTSDTHPALFEIFQYCCDSLGMNLQPKAYVTGRMRGINALSIEVKRKQIILISPKVAIMLSPEEQAFLLGHEIGHHQQGNLVCHTVNGLVENFNNASAIFGPLVLDTIEVPLKRWCRRSEFNADRAGFICCQDIQVVEQLFLKLSRHTDSSVLGEYKEIGAAHPMLRTRLEVLKEYIMNK
jgi:Zn-dependent protease with chaperone function